MQGSTMGGPTFGKIGTTGHTAQVTVAGCTLADGTEGIVNNAGECSEPTVTLTDTVLQGFTTNAIQLLHGGTLSVTGGQIANNGSARIRLGGVASPGFYTGVCCLTLRGATIQGNGNSAGDGNLVVANGSGQNCSVTSGALRLAGN